MSITSALNSAISGLTVTSRAADVVSSNLANVLTPGYGRRELEVQSLVGGSPGVRVVGITRNVDESVIADRRQADSAVAYADTQAQFLQSVDRVVGTPEDPASLTARLSRFEADMISASTNPDNQASLQTAIRSADDLTKSLNRASSEIQKQRTDADGAIGRAVDNINTLLGNIRKLNIQLNKNPSPDSYAAGLKDQRQTLVDQLSEYIPVRQVPRDNGTIALFTSGGAILLDGSAAELGFSSTNVVAPHMTLENGLLSGLTINGVSVPPSGAGSPVDGGRLAALFSVRDDLAVDAQTQLDAVSRDLLERFQDAGIDSTRAPGDPGLLTDAGAFFNSADEVGLAGRISVNALVDPAQGGEAWRLRDGLGATTPGPEGNGTLIAQLSAALSDPRGLVSGDLGANGRPASGHFSALTTRLGQDRLLADQALSFATSQQSELLDLEQLDGVDSDAEMGRLLLIEQAYSANARMLQTIDEMMQALLRI